MFSLLHSGNSWPTADILVALDNVGGFSKTQNKEITFRWCMLGIRANYRPVWTLAVELLASQGRMKYVNKQIYLHSMNPLMCTCAGHRFLSMVICYI